MGVTFVVDMNVVRQGVSTVVPNAFAGIHYLSMFGDISYASALPESMQQLLSRWLYRHGFPGSHEVQCACIERQVIELAYFAAERVILLESVQGYCRMLEVLRRLRCESWSLYDALVSRLCIVVSSLDGGTLPLFSTPVPVVVLPCWRQVHDVVAVFDLDVAAFAPVAVPEGAEKAMCL